jgi:hypothetical protein
MGKLIQGGLAGFVLRFASGLRFPWLFALTALLFVVNVFIPDALPLADEMLMGLGALLLASWKKRAAPEEGGAGAGPAAAPEPPAALEKDSADRR